MLWCFYVRYVPSSGILSGRLLDSSIKSVCLSVIRGRGQTVIKRMPWLYKRLNESVKQRTFRLAVWAEVHACLVVYINALVDRDLYFTCFAHIFAFTIVVKDILLVVGFNYNLGIALGIADINHTRHYITSVRFRVMFVIPYLSRGS